jgi:hypothetical protein
MNRPNGFAADSWKVRQAPSTIYRRIMSAGVICGGLVEMNTPR